MSIEAAVAAYKVLEEAFGLPELSGGNCGAAALAVHTKLTEAGVECALAFVAQSDADTHHDIVDGEVPLYHVVVQVGDVFLDGYKENSAEDLRQWARLEYRDRDAQLFTELQPDDPYVMSAINWDTAWYISAPTFFEALRDVDLAEAISASPAPHPGG